MSKTPSLTNNHLVKSLLVVSIIEAVFCLIFSIFTLIKIITIPPTPPTIGNPQQQQLDQALSLLEGVVQAN